MIKWRNPDVEQPEIDSQVIIYDHYRDFYKATYCNAENERYCYLIHLPCDRVAEVFGGNVRYWCFEDDILNTLPEEK